MGRWGKHGFKSDRDVRAAEGTAYVPSGHYVGERVIARGADKPARALPKIGPVPPSDAVDTARAGAKLAARHVVELLRETPAPLRVGWLREFERLLNARLGCDLVSGPGVQKVDPVQIADGAVLSDEALAPEADEDAAGL